MWTVAKPSMQGNFSVPSCADGNRRGKGNGIPADARRNVVVGLGKDNEESARIVKLDFGA
jgi:hypothetical protein